MPTKGARGGRRGLMGQSCVGASRGSCHHNFFVGRPIWLGVLWGGVAFAQAAEVRGLWRRGAVRVRGGRCGSFGGRMVGLRRDRPSPPKLANRRGATSSLNVR